MRHWIPPVLRSGGALREPDYLKAKAEAALRPSRTLAVFLPMQGHIRFVADTLERLQKSGVRIHCYTEDASRDFFHQALPKARVLPWAWGTRIPYRVVLTPATHKPTKTYAHPASRVVHTPHSMVSLHSIFPPSTFTSFHQVL